MASRRSIIREFCLNTSTHALPGIARSASLPNRLFWSISFIIFMGLMIYSIVAAAMTFFNYPTQIDLNVENEWPQYFPAVSLCNFNAFRLDRFLDPFLNYTRGRNLSTSNDTSQWSNAESAYIRDFSIDKLNRNESLDEFAFPISSLLYACRFNGQTCSADDFLVFLSSSHGKCYTFNAKPINGSIRYGNQDGGNGELTLELYIHSHQYVPYVRDGVGLVALVHDNTQLPLVESAGRYLIPGRRHRLGYRKKSLFFLSSPYTRCTRTIPRSMEIMFKHYQGADYAYSTTICTQLCTQTYLYEQCGCVNPSLWNARSIVLPKHDQIIYASLCNTSNACYRKAINDFLASDELMRAYCSDCGSQCSITEFVVEASALIAPAEWQMNGIKAFVENSSIPLASNWTTRWREHLRESYVAVSIVRETTVVENNTQRAAMNAVDLLSNIGGQMGLWIGISLLSLMELIEMLFRLIRHQYHRVWPTRRTTEQTNKDTNHIWF